MKLKFEYKTEKNYVYITMHNDYLHIAEFYKCEYNLYFILNICHFNGFITLLIFM